MCLQQEHTAINGPEELFYRSPLLAGWSSGRPGRRRCCSGLCTRDPAERCCSGLCTRDPAERTGGRARQRQGQSARETHREAERDRERRRVSLSGAQGRWLRGTWRVVGMACWCASASRASSTLPTQTDIRSVRPTNQTHARAHTHADVADQCFVALLIATGCIHFC